MNAQADCIFCKIIAGQIPSPRVYEDEGVICIRDIRPQAKTHLLVIPKAHVASIDEAFPYGGPGKADSSQSVQMMGKLFEAAAKIARQEGLRNGYRSVINTGKDGGQTVFHIHLHILGGESLDDDFG